MQIFACKKLKKGVSLNKERPLIYGMSPRFWLKKPPKCTHHGAAFFYSFLPFRKSSAASLPL